MLVNSTPSIIELIFAIIAGTSFTRLVYYISHKWKGLNKTPFEIIKKTISFGPEVIIKPVITIFFLGLPLILSVFIIFISWKIIIVNIESSSFIGVLVASVLGSSPWIAQRILGQFLRFLFNKLPEKEKGLPKFRKPKSQILHIWVLVSAYLSFVIVLVLIRL